MPLLGSDSYQHSLGTRAFLQNQATSPRSTSLWRAVAWAGLRQEIYVSISLRRPPTIKADDHLLNAQNDSDDCAWANRITSHCLDVLAFCFDTNVVGSGVYRQLLDANQYWHVECPSTYDPLVFCESDDGSHSFLWDVRFHMDWHGTIFLDAVMLNADDNSHDLAVCHPGALAPHGVRPPTTSNRVGSIRRLARGKRKAKSKYYSLMALTKQANNRGSIRLLCSVAISNPRVAPATIVASMGIMQCGDLFHDCQEQEVLLHVLNKAEMDYGWPTAAVRIDLEEAWARSRQSHEQLSATPLPNATVGENGWRSLCQRSLRRNLGREESLHGHSPLDRSPPSYNL